MKKRLRFFKSKAFLVVSFVLLYVFLAGSLGGKEEQIQKETNTQHGIKITETNTKDDSFPGRRLLAHKTRKLNCTPPAILEFPDDFFNQEQRQHGGVLLNVIISLYMFWAVAIVCDDYFVPCLEIICDRMGLQTDVAGATFMALGSSAPELFASVIGVFITKGDIGVGTILGSAVFNVLFVIGVCGIGAGTVLYLAWWPMVRDSAFYLFSLVGLMLVLMDNIVVWSEALAMVCFYSVYLLIMYFNPRIEAYLYKVTKTTSPEFKSDLHEEKANKAEEKNGYEKIRNEDAEAQKLESGEDNSEKKNIFDSGEHLAHHHEYEKHVPHEVPDLTLGSPFSPPEGTWPRICWVLGLPINAAFFFTIPDVKKPSCQRFVVFSFIMCIVWIGVTSYVLVWMVTVIGYTFLIPDSVMGLSLVAFGSSVPDCLSSLFVARKGDGDMAVSHTVGSNVFDILLCLGIPWLFKTTVWEYDSTVVINSHGLFISCFFILGSIFVTLLVIWYYKWTLNKKVGCIYLVFYFIFMSISVVVEMNAFGNFNPPMCIINV